MDEEPGQKIDRLSIRERPEGWPLMYQTWGKLLFIHWPVPVATLRPLIPAPLEIDTFDGAAWMAITPFKLWDVRPVLLPAIPGISQSHELNVRTYVQYQGAPGVWFFSLDASNVMAVLAARLGFHLPYYHAEMSLKQEGNKIHYASHRNHPGARKAEFEANWTVGGPFGRAEPETLEFFLIERYCLYTVSDGRLFRARIWHEPWLLFQAELHTFRSSMLEASGVLTPEGDPLLHYAEFVEARIWPLVKVSTSA